MRLSQLNALGRLSNITALLSPITKLIRNQEDTVRYIKEPVPQKHNLLENLNPQIIAHEPSRCEGCFDGRLPLLLIVIFIGLILFLLCLGVILDADGESMSYSLKVQCHESHFFAEKLPEVKDLG